MVPLRRWLLVAAAFAVLGSPARAQKPKTVSSRRHLQLSYASALLRGNRVSCSLNNIGEICADANNSPVVGGGFWPGDTPDQYIFNSGLEVAGMIPAAAGGGKAVFPWAGDTVGVYFVEFRGDQMAGAPLTAVLDSRSNDDLAHWPDAATVRDAAVFQATMLGKPAASDQDLWVRYWDGDPRPIPGRAHPMGILVDQRAMAWNAPPQNADVAYFVFTLTNVTARNPNVYNNATVDPALRADFARYGAQFQDSSEAHLGVSIPDSGYPLTSVYVALVMDPDVGNASFNYSNVVLPFRTALAYKSDFLEPTWTFPLEIFGPPLVKAPGFVGAMLARTPADTTGSGGGVTVFSNYTGSATGYPDPVGVPQMFRYISGTSNPAVGDGPCTFQGQQLVLHFCFLQGNSGDTRYFLSTGPFTLPAGESRTLIVAYVFAGATSTVLPSIGGEFKPGLPATGDSIAADTTKVRPLERAVGWITQADANANGRIESNEVRTVRRSLLAKAQMAQGIVDAKFLLPQAPEPPVFYLLPGDNQVTVVWQKSPTETSGDPYFALASDPTSALYDPNYRQFDVEGYRVYRGRDPNALSLVAQFDYGGTTMTDYTGDFLYPGECAPELGILTDCQVPFDSLPPYTQSVTHDLVGAVVQIPVAGRELQGGKVFVVHSDTAVSGGGKGYPSLRDTGVDFSFTDRGVRNSFNYYYAVTAFDVNSLASGPSSLESARLVKPVTPRYPASNTRGPVLVRSASGTDDVALDTAAPWPAIDSATGTFAGNVPPTLAATLELLNPALELLPAGDITTRVDSLSAGFVDGIGAPPTVYLTFTAPGDRRSVALPLVQPSFISTSQRSFSTHVPLVPYDSVAARRFGVHLDTSARMPLTFSGPVPPAALASPAIASIIGRYGLSLNGTLSGAEYARYLAHSRWFDPDAPEPPDPTIMGYPDSAHHAGKLTGVGRIWSPQAYRDRWQNGSAGPRGAISVQARGYSYAATGWYAADYLVTWGADSSITVFDSTYHVPLPFAAQGGGGWGFVNVRAFLAAGIRSFDISDGTGTADVNILGYHHLYGTPPVCSGWWIITCASLEARAQYEPLEFDSDGVADANGIGLMVNGEFFMMEMAKIPPAGTRWRLRAMSGLDTASSCTISGTPPPPAYVQNLGPVMTDCTGYGYAPYPAYTGASAAWVPGLTYKLTVQPAYTVDSSKSGDLSRIHTVPDPYYVTNALETAATAKVLKFVYLPSQAIIRIYSASGILVQVLTHNDPSGGGEATWDLKTRNGRYVASGVYFYHVETADKRSKIGRFTLVSYKP